MVINLNRNLSIGHPCKLRPIIKAGDDSYEGVLGRIVAIEKGDYYDRFVFCTPGNTLFAAAVSSHFEDLSEEGMAKLNNYERKDLLQEKQIYLGKLDELEFINKSTINNKQ
jgi:hypothetical protein